jgi:hypothetical protein
VFLVTTYKLKADLTKEQKRQFLTAVGSTNRPGRQAKRLPAPPGAQHYITEDGRSGLIIVPTDLAVKAPASDWVEEFTEDYKPWVVYERPEIMHQLDASIVEIVARHLLS